MNQEPKRCGAKTRSGELCKNWGMEPSGRCRMHGGKSLRGIASPQFKHGRYSKAMPERLLSRYKEAQSDKRLLELSEEISLIDARLADVLQRVDSGDSGQLWTALKAAHSSFVDARTKGDVPTMTARLNELGELIDSGLDDYAAWGEVGKLLEQRRRFVESERKRMVEMQQMITADRAMVLLAAVVDVIRRHVDDRGALAAISRDIGALVAIGTTDSPDSPA